MAHAFCFQCQVLVEVLENKELACGHTVADQQTMYEFLIDKVDSVLQRVYTEYQINTPERERRKKAFEITMDLLGEWYSKNFTL
jgi:hypothetical protein